MTCKDCLNQDSCPIKNKCSKNEIPMASSKSMENYCNFFKDRSRFVELPCKVGDVIHSIEHGYIKNDSVTNIVYYANINEFVIQAHFTCFNEKAFGKTIFFTKEEAEQALKEREGNAT